GSVVDFSVWAMLYAHALYEYRGDGRLRATTMSVISISGHGWYFPPKRSARAAARAAMMVSASATGSSSEVWVAPRGSSGRKNMVAGGHHVLEEIGRASCRERVGVWQGDDSL